MKKDPNELTNLYKSKKHQRLVTKLKDELNNLKKEYKNNLSLSEMRKISDIDFGGLESNKGKK